MTQNNDDEANGDADLLASVDRLRLTADDLTRRSTGFPRPLASLVLLDALADAQAKLAVVYRQLGHWHATVSTGTHFKSDGTDPSGPDRAEAALALAQRHAEAAADALLTAHTANGATQWFDTAPQPRVENVRKPEQRPTRLRAV